MGNAIDIWYRIALALGDACLLVQQKYAVLLQTRARLLSQWQRESGVQWLREIDYLYQEALQYLLLPSDFLSQQTPWHTRYQQLTRLFVKTYLYVFECLMERPVELQDFDQLFTHKNERFFNRQLQLLLSRWLQNEPIRKWLPTQGRSYRLYYLLPFLLQNQAPSGKVLGQICPEINSETDLSNLMIYFQTLWNSIEQELI